jgi:hypothetical protein
MTFDPEPGPVDWARIDLLLISRHGFRPWELDWLTLSEVAICLEDPDVVRPPHGHTPMTSFEIQAAIQRLQSMTCVERMEAAKKGEL